MARFACAQACTECARACALRASCMIRTAAEERLIRREGILCAEVCDATCRVLSEQLEQDGPTPAAVVPGGLPGERPCLRGVRRGGERGEGLP